MTTSGSPQRVLFRLRVKPEMLDEYLRRHDPVWPEMLAEIAASGRRNYSIFHIGGGELIGVYETDDDAASQRYLASSDIAARWEAEMAPFFVAQTGRADQNAETFPEIFHLDSQLRAANGGGAHT
ncbi:L-rhamnose mutarotase [Microbacterium amylolyticum]|uniref:L-rhamnose mutarotase n=1 Tax=Microbacterium amylolyticum TaxID=936337 RepID=A0ABS4ZH94_9MICO|nr:L-rhamnose mutarotase [Microbacterium amylolyticum]MBP2436642.1 L-rhamnose mutarotase [Microbacterium amylolyticum]